MVHAASFALLSPAHLSIAGNSMAPSLPAQTFLCVSSDADPFPPPLLLLQQNPPPLIFTTTGPGCHCAVRSPRREVSHTVCLPCVSTGTVARE